MAEVVSEAFVSELSASASHRLDAVTEDHHSCVDVQSILSRRVDIKSPLTHSKTSRSGIASANVKIIIADVDSMLNVRTVLVDGQHLTIYFSMFAKASILDHDFGRLCRGRRIQMSGHSDLGIFSNFGASSIFTWV